jgi:hypothetical protein
MLEWLKACSAVLKPNQNTSANAKSILEPKKKKIDISDTWLAAEIN